MIRAGVVRFWWRTVFALCERHRFDGADVRIFLPGTAERQILVQKCRGAFELLRTYAPRQLLRLRNFTDGVLVLGEDSFVLGEWMAPARLIRLNAAFMLKPETRPVDIAATVVHETTHAWLEHCGYRYTVERRPRIEAICYRSEAAFARQLPDGEDLATVFDICAELALQDENAWTDTALRELTLNQLREIGAPTWITNAHCTPNSRMTATRVECYLLC